MMRSRLILAAAAALGMTGAATATDLYQVVEPTPFVADSGFDWEGFYAGVGIGFMTSTTSVERAISLNKYLGANFVSGDLLFGVEGYFGYNYSLDFFDWTVIGAEGRVGFLASEDILLYGAAGISANLGGGGIVRATYGGGVEFAVGDSSSIDLGYRFVDSISGSGWNAHWFSASWNWHFN